MGRWFGYILLTILIGGVCFFVITPEITLILSMFVIIGTLFYIVHILKNELPRVVQDRLERRFNKIDKSLEELKNRYKQEAE
ncbi:hypothetical protein ABE237_02485 [Brevibacillus formosus]|uniref:hypothetical protein n=1 Tax=Brevibacillus TaxID=55080 RepID=UPI000D0E7488|nr:MULTISPECIES: hypothetical protein [Brevibacillus]MBG9942703.1 hypothetical protein [Brevibacillus formosus]MBW5469063.1 hypothetical protein [Brevibacillus formosus]MED1945071.1 hypothetical protein [Brevibacillus formosus]MED1996242.1 hypothetical protein [Brevibacillus formosus]MED2081211.1 hypothetical protein [Brevibacillus formosus]